MEHGIERAPKVRELQRDRAPKVRVCVCVWHYIFLFV